MARVADQIIQILFKSLLATELEIATFAGLLSPTEREKAARFRFPRDRRRYVAGRSALRIALAAHLGIAPETIEIQAGPNGKPNVAQESESSIRFNVSHSGELICIAISRTCEIGVDIEEVRDDADHRQIATRFFTPAENQLLCREQEFPSAFLQIWTAKEAYLKGVGLGLSVDPQLVSVARKPNGSWGIDCQGTQESWSLMPIECPSGYVGFLAVQCPINELTVEYTR